MTKEEILKKLIEQMGDGVWMLFTLKEEPFPVNKKKLRELTNKNYAHKRGEKLIRSRHSLDRITAKLEGAGLVTVDSIGRTKMYRLSQLGEELITFQKKERER